MSATDFATVLGSETYLKIQNNKITNKSLSLGGRYAGEDADMTTAYQLEVGIEPGKTFSTNRKFILGVENDMNTGTIFTYSPGLEIFAYKGDLTGTQIGQITISAMNSANSTISIDTTSVTGSPTGNIFMAGDWLQPKGSSDNYMYPYQVANNVAFSSGTIAVPLNRVPIAQSNTSVGGNGIRVGKGNITFNVKHAEYNPYYIVPHDRLQYEQESFNLIEVIQ